MDVDYRDLGPDDYMQMSREQIIATINDLADADYPVDGLQDTESIAWSLLEVVERLRADLDALRAQVAETWVPLTAQDELPMFTERCRAILKIVGNGDIFLVNPSIDDEVDDDSIVALFHPGPDYAFCRRVPAAQPQADPIRHLIPPLSEWPDDAVAWMTDPDGKWRWLYRFNDSWKVINGAGRSVLPPDFDCRGSLRLRPQPDRADGGAA